MQKNERIGGTVYERSYVYNFHYHLIWVTKYKKPVFTTPVLIDEMKTILKDLSAVNEILIEEMEVMPDHVHLLISCNPQYGIMNCIRALKRYSAAPMREFDPSLDRRLPSIWTRSAFIATVGSVSLETVKAYIESQKEQ